MTWRLARSLTMLQSQVNQKWPNRSKASDGTIGNEAHAARSSDHNPWVKDGDVGIVTALDITHDPVHGLDSEHLAEALRSSRDPRLKYVISNRKIASFDHGDWVWRHYSGANAHNHHCHVSVKPDKTHYDNIEPWRIDHVVLVSAAPQEKPHQPVKPLLTLNSTGEAVVELQTKLFVTGRFDVRTEDAIKEFQQAHGLTPDGKVGPYTWEKL